MHSPGGLQCKGSLEIVLLDPLGLVPGPRLQTHPPYQTEIEYLGIVGNLGRPVSIGMKMVTREFIAIAAELDRLPVDTSIYIAWLGHAEKGDGAVFVAAPLADRLLERDPLLL